MIIHETQLRARYVETDAMGHVHHGSYLNWMECARVEMLDAWGLPYTELEKEGYLMPVIAVNLEYKQPAYFHELITIIVKVDEVPKRTRLKLEYDIMRGETLLAKASSMHTFMTKEGKPLRPPKSFMNAIHVRFPNL